MLSFFRRCFCLIMISAIPMTTFSAQAAVKLLNAADFNQATAAANQHNSYTPPPPCNCNNSNTSATSAATPTPVYYAPPAASTASPASQTETNTTQSNKSNSSGILFGSGTSDSPGLLIH